MRLVLFDAERQALVVQRDRPVEDAGRPPVAPVTWSCASCWRAAARSCSTGGRAACWRPPMLPEPASHRAVALLRLKGTILGYLLVGRDQDLPPYTAVDLTPLQILADVAGLRLAYSQLAIRPLHRERELAQLAPAWRPPVDLAGDLVVILDFRGCVVDADGGATRLLGYSRDELLQMAIPDFSPLPPGVDERAALAEFLQRVLDSGTVAYESSTRRRDDSLFRCVCSSKSRADPRAACSGALSGPQRAQGSAGAAPADGAPARARPDGLGRGPRSQQYAGPRARQPAAPARLRRRSGPAHPARARSTGCPRRRRDGQATAQLRPLARGVGGNRGPGCCRRRGRRADAPELGGADAAEGRAGPGRRRLHPVPAVFGNAAELREAP